MKINVNKFDMWEIDIWMKKKYYVCKNVIRMLNDSRLSMLVNRLYFSVSFNC